MQTTSPDQQIAELTARVETLETLLFAVKAMFETVGLCFSEVAKLDGSFPEEGLKIIDGGKRKSLPHKPD